MGGTVLVGNEVGVGSDGVGGNGEVGLTVGEGSEVGRGVLVGMGVLVAVGGAAVGCWNKGVGELAVGTGPLTKGVRVGTETATSSVGRMVVVPPREITSPSPKTML